jgi:c-di-GMP-binding flagellar brake protein YcgR
MEANDRRKSPRVPVAVSGVVGSGSSRPCRVANLSTTGALVVVSEPLKEMVVVRVDFELCNEENAKDISVEAAVVRCDQRPDGQFDVGLYFTKIAPSARAAIARLVDASIVPTSH